MLAAPSAADTWCPEMEGRREGGKVKRGEGGREGGKEGGKERGGREG